MPSAITLLEQDHRAVEKLFTQFTRSHDPSIAMRICEELDVHTEVEEQIIYPALRSEVSSEMADEAEREHAEAKQLIGRIKRTEDAGHLGALVAELEQAIQHHVSEEESEVFPKMNKALGADRMNELGDEIEARKKELRAA